MAATAEHRDTCAITTRREIGVLEIVPARVQLVRLAEAGSEDGVDAEFVQKVSMGGVHDSTCAVAQVRELAAAPPVGELHGHSSSSRHSLRPITNKRTGGLPSSAESSAPRCRPRNASTSPAQSPCEWAGASRPERTPNGRSPTGSRKWMCVQGPTMSRVS